MFSKYSVVKKINQRKNDHIPYTTNWLPSLSKLFPDIKMRKVKKKDKKDILKNSKCALTATITLN